MIEIAADAEPPAPERLHSGQLAFAQREPGGRIRGDRHVSSPAGGSLAHPGGAPGEADFPRMADIAKADPVGGIEVRIRSQIALGEGLECALHPVQTPSVGKLPDHGGHPTRLPGRMRRGSAGRGRLGFGGDVGSPPARHANRPALAS